MKPTEQTNPFSRALHSVDRATSRPTTAIVVAASIVVFGLVLAAARFPDDLADRVCDSLRGCDDRDGVHDSTYAEP